MDAKVLTCSSEALARLDITQAALDEHVAQLRAFVRILESAHERTRFIAELKRSPSDSGNATNASDTPACR